MANRSSFLCSISLVLLAALCFGAVGADRALLHGDATTGFPDAHDTAKNLYSHFEISRAVTPLLREDIPATVAVPGDIDPLLAKAGAGAIGTIPNRTAVICALKERLEAGGSRSPLMVSGVGTVVYVDIEGGFWGIVGDDGSHFLPANLPDSCKVNGLRVKFLGREGKPVMDIRMWGTPLRLLSVNPVGDEIVASGTIEYIELEGGFFGIVASDGEYYLPLNLPAGFAVDGLEVTFTGRTAPEINTIYMWGTPVTVVSIARNVNDAKSESSALIGSWTLCGMAKGGAITPVIQGSVITAVFSSDGRVSGTSGCNLYSASLTLDGMALSIGPVLSTLMYCDDTPRGVMKQESTYLQCLEEAASWKIRGEELVIADESGGEILVFSPGIADRSGGEEPLVEFWRTGGFAGMDDHLVIYPDGSVSLTRKDYTAGFTLTENELETLSLLFEESGFMNLALQYQAPPGSADLFIYQIRWQDKTVLAEDTVVPDSLRPLIDELTRLVADHAPDDVMLPLAVC